MSGGDYALYYLGGRWYRWLGPWFGAQMESWEYRRARAGTGRVLNGFVFVVFQTGARDWRLRVRHSWALASAAGAPIDDACHRIAEFKSALNAL